MGASFGALHWLPSNFVPEEMSFDSDRDRWTQLLLRAGEAKHWNIFGHRIHISSSERETWSAPALPT